MSADHIATALGAVMCPPEHEGTNGIFADGSRCYVCIARALAADLEQVKEGWQVAEARARTAEAHADAAEARVKQLEAQRG